MHEEGGRMHPHLDATGTEAVVILSLGAPAVFFVDQKKRCKASLTKECWCIGNTTAQGKGHWVCKQDCIEGELLDRRCVPCATGGVGIACPTCTEGEVTLFSGDVLVFHGASKTGIVHGVRAVEAMGDEKSADSLFHPNARKKKKGCKDKLEGCHETKVATENNDTRWLPAWILYMHRASIQWRGTRFESKQNDLNSRNRSNLRCLAKKKKDYGWPGVLKAEAEWAGHASAVIVPCPPGSEWKHRKTPPCVATVLNAICKHAVQTNTVAALELRLNEFHAVSLKLDDALKKLGTRSALATSLQESFPEWSALASNESSYAHNLCGFAYSKKRLHVVRTLVLKRTNFDYFRNQLPPLRQIEHWFEMESAFGVRNTLVLRGCCSPTRQNIHKFCGVNQYSIQATVADKEEKDGSRAMAINRVSNPNQPTELFEVDRITRDWASGRHTEDHVTSTLKPAGLPPFGSTSSSSSSPSSSSPYLAVSTSPPPPKKHCQYGAQCYRQQNAAHTAEFTHPALASGYSSPSPASSGSHWQCM